MGWAFGDHLACDLVSIGILERQERFTVTSRLVHWNTGPVPWNCTSQGVIAVKNLILVEK
jgi:hypothetical protein